VGVDATGHFTPETHQRHGCGILHRMSTQAVNPFAAGDSGPVSIAMVITCAGRWDFLKQTMPTWQAIPDVVRKVIVTYSFDTIPDWVSGVTLVVIDSPDYHRTRAVNTGVKHAIKAYNPSHLMMIDTDILVRDPMVFHRVLKGSATRPHFLVDSPYAIPQVANSLPDPRMHDPENYHDGRGRRGTHVVWSPLFVHINGYDQRLIGWGLEDLNLYSRYYAFSKRVGYYNRDLIYHIPHGDDLRQKLNPKGENLATRAEVNRRIHNESIDMRGEAWRGAIGYERVAIVER